MNKFFVKHKKELVVLLGVIVLALFLRTLRILINQQPVFADEAIYIRWAQIMKNEPTLRFIPLSDGKQPLYMWILMFFFKIVSNPLYAGRFLSTFAGISTLVGIYFLTHLLTKSFKISLLAVLIYAVCPFVLFFDSMALVDALLSMFGVWLAYFAILAVKTERYDFAMLAGFVLGGALLTKSPAIYFSILLPSAVLFTNRKFKELKIFSNLIRLISLFVPIYIIAYAMYNILRLGPNFQLISSRNADYIFPISHIWLNPLDPFQFHLKDILNWVWLIGPGIIIPLFLIGILAGFIKYSKQTIFLLLWVLFPLFVNSMYAKVFTARYILFSVPFIIIVSAFAVDLKLKSKILVKLLIGLFTVTSLIIDYLLIFNLQKAPLPVSERSGYLEEWTAGYGILEVADYVKTYHAQNPAKKIIIGTEGYFGTLPDGLQMYLNKYPEIIVIGVGIDLNDLPRSLAESRNAGNQTYLVINNSRLIGDPGKMGLNLIASYPKAFRTPGRHEYSLYGPQEFLYFFEVK